MCWSVVAQRKRDGRESQRCVELRWCCRAPSNFVFFLSQSAAITHRSLDRNKPTLFVLFGPQSVRILFCTWRGRREAALRHRLVSPAARRLGVPAHVHVPFGLRIFCALADCTLRARVRATRGGLDAAAASNMLQQKWPPPFTSAAPQPPLYPQQQHKSYARARVCVSAHACAAKP